MSTTTTTAGSASPSASAGAVRTLVFPPAAWPRVLPAWSELAAAAPRSSFFTSPAWVGTWIEIYRALLDISVVVFDTAEGVVAACLLAANRPRHAGISLRRVSLNAGGEDAADTTYVEYNQLLCRPGWEDAVTAALAALLRKQPWDEFALDGFSPGPDYDAVKRAFHDFELEESWQPSYAVDLATLRCSGRPYLSTLSRHRRKLLRQSIRAYSELGEIRLEAASDAATALRMFEELSQLNCRRWAVRSRQSVFQSPHFTAFHRHLIERCLPAGSVQLLRVSAGDQTIGLLYNLLHRGKVYFYQCGFDYGLHSHFSPGVISLTHAIQYCLERGLDYWDFLSGEADYKRMLSTGSYRLIWAVFRRASPRVRVWSLARAGKRALLRLRDRDWRAPWRARNVHE